MVTTPQRSSITGNGHWRGYGTLRRLAYLGRRNRAWSARGASSAARGRCSWRDFMIIGGRRHNSDGQRPRPHASAHLRPARHDQPHAPHASKKREPIQSAHICIRRIRAAAALVLASPCSRANARMGSTTSVDHLRISRIPLAGHPEWLDLHAGEHLRFDYQEATPHSATAGGARRRSDDGRRGR